MVKMKTVITLSFIAPFEKCKKNKQLFILSHLLKDVCASCFNLTIFEFRFNRVFEAMHHTGTDE